MYRMVKAEGKDGTNKLGDIAAIHSLEGCFYIVPEVGRDICFVYNDHSGQMMRSTKIEDIKVEDGQLKITTRNTEYWFEKVEV